MSTVDLEPLLEVPLRGILSWERSGKFECVGGSPSQLLILRLTLDSVGIRKVEYLPGPPLYVRECTSHSTFIV